MKQSFRCHSPTQTPGNLNGCLAATSAAMQAETQLPSVGQPDRIFLSTTAGIEWSVLGPDIGGLVSAAITLILLTAISGQDQGATDAESKEIVVTGERVPRSLRETASSVAVITAEDIEGSSGADRLDDILEQVPNIQFGSGNLGPAIRGQDTTGALQDLPAFLGGNRARVTVQVDGRAVGYSEFVSGVTPLWDVEQIEVFRSPQSTTQGRNSIAGAIFVTTKDPTFQPEASARLIAGDYQTRQLSAVVSGPLIDDDIAIRIAGDLRRSRTVNEFRDLPDADPNRHRYGLVRVKLLAQPSAIPQARLEVSYTHTESSAPQFESVQPPFRERRNILAVPVSRNRIDALTASLALDLDEKLDGLTTASFGKSRFRRFPPLPGLGETDTRTVDGSFESVWHWRPGKSVQLSGGFHHVRSNLDQDIDLTRVLGVGNFADRQRSLGLFSDGTVRLTPELSVTAGLRYQRDGQDRQGGLGSDSFTGEIDFDRDFKAWLPKLSVAYDLTADVTIGALVQRAYNPGGITLNFDTGQQVPFGAEKLWSYELFARARLPSQRLRLNANLFYNDFRDAQRTQIRAFSVPGGSTAFWAIIHNVPKARSYGLEASVDWHANERLRLRGGLGLLRTKIVDAGEFTAIQGNHFGRSPKLTASASIEWNPVDRLSLNASLRHNSDYFSNDANNPALRVDGSTRLDARAAYDWGPVTLFGYVRNLFDQCYLVHLNSPTLATVGEPRRFGIGLETRL
jgi:iron complex outermembrane receptor protein